jgi:DNA-binding NtrC family response regulator
MDAHSADDALELLHILRFDLVILGEDRLGDAVPALLKRIQIISSGTRCIVVSSRMDERRERAIRQAGAMAILDAPLPFARLRDVVGHVAAGR